MHIYICLHACKIKTCHTETMPHACSVNFKLSCTRTVVIHIVFVSTVYKTACVCTLSCFSLLLAVCMDGSFYRYLFTAEPGQTNNCIRDSFDIFLDIGNDGI